MKKTILFFILLSGMAFGQETAVTSSGKKVILNNDQTWKLDEQKNEGLRSEYFNSKNNKDVVVGLFEKIQIPVSNGEDKNVDVNFEFISSADQFSKISVDKINKIISYSRDYLLLNLKNRYSFIPRKIKISYSEKKNAWFVIWDYTAKNSYGGEVQGDKFMLYDDNLNRIEF